MDSCMEVPAWVLLKQTNFKYINEFMIDIILAHSRQGWN